MNYRTNGDPNVPAATLNAIPPANPNEVRVGDKLWADVGNVTQSPHTEYDRRAFVHWNQNEPATANTRTPIDYFLKCFPTNMWARILAYTNAKMESTHLAANVTMTELVKFFGIRLAMSLEHGHGDVDSFWKTTSDTFCLPSNYLLRTGMTCTRFKKISRGLCFQDIQVPFVSFEICFILKIITL